MKKFQVILAFLPISLLFSFTNSDTDLLILDYVDQYNLIAVQEMHRTGVPASITLAQGIVESRYGLSGLAKNSNNHFGIKCNNNWTGGKYYHKDDDYEDGKLIKSCFRTYDNPAQSYIDHSDFLVVNQRYHFLFTLDKTDYKGWAKGLKKAGYATAKHYASSLINTIEKYELYKYDYEEVDELVFQPINEPIPPSAEPIGDAEYIDFVAPTDQPTTQPYAETLVAEAPPQSVRLPSNYKAGDGLRAIEKSNFQEDVFGGSSQYLEEITPRTYAKN